MSEVNYVSNILDNFDNTTYHFRLYMVKETGAPRLLEYNKVKQPDSVLLAETGSTRVAIESVEVESMLNINPKTKTSTFTGVSINLQEINTVRFFDVLAKEARNIGISRFIQATYYLELTFKGREANTSLPIMEQGALVPKKWIWPLYFREVDTQITAGGATYSISAVPYEETPLGDQLGCLHKDFVATNVKTAMDVFDRLSEEYNNPPADAQEKENKQEAEDSDNKNVIHPNTKNKNAIFFDVSKVKNPKETLKITANQEKINQMKLQENISYDVTDDKVTLTFSKGTSYVDMIDMVMSLTKKAQVIAEESIEAQKALEKGKEPPNTNYKIKNLYRVDTRSCPIKPGEGKNISHKASSGNSFPPNAVKGDIEVNPETNKYSQIMVFYVRDYFQPTVIDQSNYNDDPTTSADVLANIKKIYYYNYTGLNDQVVDFDINFKFAFATLIPSASGYDQANSEVNTISYENCEVISEKPLKALEFNGGKKAGKSSTSQQNTLNVNGSSFSFDTDEANFLRVQKARLPESENVTTSSGTEGGSSTRNFFNSLLNQAMNQGGEQGDMINLEMKIKGDPFWLGPAYNIGTTDIDRLSIDSNVTDDQLSVGNAPPMILVRILTPDEADLQTGIVQSSLSRNNETISGLYSINFVTHSFRNGEFEQQIKGFRESRTTIDRVNRLIDKATPASAKNKE